MAPWTKIQEDQLTLAVRARQREKGSQILAPTDWTAIALQVDDRTGTQCSKTWKERLDPDVNRKQWSEEDKAKVIQAQISLGDNKYAEIAATVVPDRNQYELRNLCKSKSWKKRLQEAKDSAPAEVGSSIVNNPPPVSAAVGANKRSKFTDAEDVVLKKAVADFKASERYRQLGALLWGPISQSMPGRSEDACKRRWYDHLAATVSAGSEGESSDSSGGGTKRLASESSSAPSPKSAKLNDGGGSLPTTHANVRPSEVADTSESACREEGSESRASSGGGTKRLGGEHISAPTPKSARTEGGGRTRITEAIIRPSAVPSMATQAKGADSSGMAQRIGGGTAGARASKMSAVLSTPLSPAKTNSNGGDSLLRAPSLSQEQKARMEKNRQLPQRGGSEGGLKMSVVVSTPLSPAKTNSNGGDRIAAEPVLSAEQKARMERNRQEAVATLSHKKGGRGSGNRSDVVPANTATIKSPGILGDSHVDVTSKPSGRSVGATNSSARSVVASKSSSSHSISKEADKRRLDELLSRGAVVKESTPKPYNKYNERRAWSKEFMQGLTDTSKGLTA